MPSASIRQQVFSRGAHRWHHTRAEHHSSDRRRARSESAGQPAVYCRRSAAVAATCGSRSTQVYLLVRSGQPAHVGERVLFLRSCCTQPLVWPRGNLAPRCRRRSHVLVRPHGRCVFIILRTCWRKYASARSTTSVRAPRAIIHVLLDDCSCDEMLGINSCCSFASTERVM